MIVPLFSRMWEPCTCYISNYRTYRYADKFIGTNCTSLLRALCLFVCLFISWVEVCIFVLRWKCAENGTTKIMHWSFMWRLPRKKNPQSAARESSASFQQQSECRLHTTSSFTRSRSCIYYSDSSSNGLSTSGVLSFPKCNVLYPTVLFFVATRWWWTWRHRDFVATV